MFHVSVSFGDLSSLANRPDGNYPDWHQRLVPVVCSYLGDPVDDVQAFDSLSEDGVGSI